jgi:hypothetical protein
MSILTVEHAVVASAGGAIGYSLTKIEAWIKAWIASAKAKVAAAEAAVKKAV